MYYYKMEMGGNKQICRLCLEIVPPGDAEPIGEKKKEILEVLLINVDLHVIDNAVACSRCMEELQSGFELKSACFHVDNCISTYVVAGVPVVDMKKIFQGEMRGTAMANVNLENRQICRLCMSLIEDQALDCHTDLKDIIANCLPEVDIHTVQESLVCELCFSRMKKLNEFMNSCHEVERRINNFCLQAGVDHAIPVSVNLNDLLKSEDNIISRLIKEESSNFDSNLLKDPKKEDATNIECEEIHINDELDSVGEMGGSIPSGACNKSGTSGSLIKRKRQFTSKGRKHFSSDRHRGLNKEFACQECTYETDNRSILSRHMIRHKKSELEMRKCEICEFETSYKSSMIKHMLRHGKTKPERKFKCDKCPYETDFKTCIRRHNLLHKDKSEVEMHKCYNCEFETRRKDYMKQHVLSHRDPKTERKFKCDKCSYEANDKSTLGRHYLRHMDESEVQMHKCPNCEYETKRKDTLISHMLKHKDKSEVEMHKCENCEYETKYKRCMSRHMLSHHDPIVERKFKCDKCRYQTNYRSVLNKHALVHKYENDPAHGGAS